MPILGIIASSTLAAAGDFESIATVSVGSGGAASATFSSIPATYTHLQLRISARTASGDDIIVFRVNSDSTNAYSIHRLFGNGTSATASATISYNYGGIGITPSSADVFGASVCDILDYANTNKYKTFRSLSGREDNSAGLIELRSSLWNNTNAVSSIVVTNDSATNFAQYSHFALYGIKGA